VLFRATPRLNNSEYIPVQNKQKGSSPQAFLLFLTNTGFDLGLINGKNDHSICYLIGTKQYVFENGKSFDIHYSKKPLFVNDNKIALLYKEIIYSTIAYNFQNDSAKVLPAYSVTELPGKVDYFNGESVPSTIEGHPYDITTKHYLIEDNRVYLSSPATIDEPIHN